MLHFFCTEKDYGLIIDFLLNQGLNILEQGGRNDNENAFSSHEIRFYTKNPGNDKSYISIAPPHNEVNMTGVLTINGAQDRVLSQVYRKIKRYIKSTYISESGYYIGQDLYQKWYNREIRMDKMFLKSKQTSCFMQEKELQELIDFLNGKGYEIVNKDIGETVITSKRALKPILIYPHGAHLFSYQTTVTIVGVGTFHGETYNTESEAVFAFFNQTRERINCKFIIDERNYDHNKQLFDLFTTIKTYVDSINGLIEC